MGAHATLGASSAHRWMECPGSVELSALAPPSPESEYAYEGTCAHYLAEKSLLDRVAPSHFVGKQLTLPQGDRYKEFPESFEVTQEMANFVAEYVDLCNSIKADAYEVEARIDYSRWVPGGFGTADYVAIKGTTLHVVDLKYGQGEPVDAFENKQLMLYALGAYDFMSQLYPVQNIEMTISQPRLDSVTTYKTTPRELIPFGKVAAQAAEAALSTDAPLHAGKSQCRWCPAKNLDGGCKEHDRFVLEDALDGLDVFGTDLESDAHEKHLRNASDERLAKIIGNAKVLTELIALAKSQAEAKLLSGETSEHLKLVRGRGSKEYTLPEEQILAKLSNARFVKATDVYTKKVITPAQITKLLGPKHHWVKKYVKVLEGRPTVALKTDSRKPIDLQAEALEGL